MRSRAAVIKHRAARCGDALGGGRADDKSRWTR
jgi:hypothetical protein